MSAHDSQPGGGSRADPNGVRRGGPLVGTRVLELGTLIAGPFAGRLLADMGAEVIKIERPGHPDPLREWGQGRYEGRALWWPVQSRNKKCVTLDLGHERGRELFVELARRSDVVLENFKPGALEKWGLAYDVLSAINPGLVLVRVSGFGQTGPYARRAGFAAVAEAMGGLRYINGFPGEAPPRLGISLGDSLAAMFAVQGVLAALHARDHVQGGRGQEVDVSLLESCFAMLESAIPEYDRLGLVREPSGTRLQGNAPSNIFRSKDGAWLVIAANQDGLFRRLCEAMEQPELADDTRFATHEARGAHQLEIEGIIAEWAGGLDAQAIDALLNERGVVCGPLYTTADIFGDPHFRAREMLVECSDPEFGSYVGPGIVPKFSQTPGAIDWSGPWQPGSHNDEVFGELLGLTPQELARLREEGAL
jgi:formyl-CoA transferase